MNARIRILAAGVISTAALGLMLAAAAPATASISAAGTGALPCATAQVSQLCHLD
jgi:hypothetical protein